MAIDGADAHHFQGHEEVLIVHLVCKVLSEDRVSEDLGLGVDLVVGFPIVPESPSLVLVFNFRP